MSESRTFDVDGVPTTAVTDLPEDATVLDVREDDEWAAGHIAGALHIPMGQVPQRLEDLPEGQLHVVCRSGGRSQRTAVWVAAQRLRRGERRRRDVGVGRGRPGHGLGVGSGALRPLTRGRRQDTLAGRSR